MSSMDFEDRTMKLNATEREHAESISALADGAHQDMSATVRSSLIGKVARDEVDAMRWARYHSIGDMLRSPDLTPTTRDEAFLTRMRLSLAVEPVVISPQAESALGARIAPQAKGERIAVNGGVMGGSATRSFPMRAVSITGGLIAVAAIAASWSAFGPNRSAPAAPAAVELSQSASTSPVSRVRAVTATPTDAASPSLVVVQTANGAVIRDARLDQYFAAHSGVRSGAGLGAGANMAAPAAFVRSASIDSAAHQ